MHEPLRKKYYSHRVMKQKEPFNQKKPPLVIKSEEEFLALMEDIDREMIAENTKITARPIIAGLKFAKRHNVTLNAIPPNRPPKKDCFDPLEISIRIHKWIEQRYGERIKVYFHTGRVVFPLRGDLYVVNCPKMYGTVKFVCDPNTFGDKGSKIGKNKPPICNILDSIENLTANFAKSLNAEEIVKITAAFISGMGAYMNLEAINDLDYINEATGDLDAAVSHLMSNRPQPGLSKWSSLQAVEKLVKTYISQKGEKIKRTHSLNTLFGQAKELGLIVPPQIYIDDVQCSAGVRYGETPVSIEDAVKAHLISLEICEVTSQCIGKLLNKSMPSIPEPLIDGIPLTQFCSKHMKT